MAVPVLARRALGAAAQIRTKLQERPLPEAFVEPLRGAAGIEVGGPSHLFRSRGPLPAYGLLGSIDGCDFSEQTIWSGERGARYEVEGRDRGRMFYVDAVELAGVPDRSYDVLLASHVIEHIANPLRALDTWRRVVRPGGHLLLVAPHKERTFDRRRPTTPLAHMVEDYERGTGEDDLTHLDEVLALHDLSKDVGAGSREEFERRTRANPENRGMHQHVFTTRSFVALLDRAGLDVRAVAARRAHDIFVLARVPLDGERPDNAAALDPAAEHFRTSPFKADRPS
jgi:SAM-dependent methyltransferase